MVPTSLRQLDNASHVELTLASSLADLTNHCTRGHLHAIELDLGEPLSQVNVLHRRHGQPSGACEDRKLPQPGNLCRAATRNLLRLSARLHRPLMPSRIYRSPLPVADGVILPRPLLVGDRHDTTTPP
jgi:hypothetical protein